MGNVYTGTSGWAYATWKPGFYPQKLSAAKFLGYYSTRLNSVEVNYTFRTLPTEKLLTGWIAATPPEFKFAMKAHQGITHVKRLRNADALAANFLNALAPLQKAHKLGPILFQLPGFVKCDPVLLADFLATLPGRYQYAFEFRHASWFTDEVYAILRKANAALCLAESADLEAPNVTTADFSYLRLRKDKYPPKARRQVAETVSRLAEIGDVFAYFKHEDKPDGPLYAEALLST